MVFTCRADGMEHNSIRQCACDMAVRENAVAQREYRGYAAAGSSVIHIALGSDAATTNTWVCWVRLQVAIPGLSTAFFWELK